MTRGAMMMISAATAGILMAGTAAAISVVNATETAPTSHTIDLLAEQPPLPVLTPTAPAGQTRTSVAPITEQAGVGSKQPETSVPTRVKDPVVSPASASPSPSFQSDEDELEYEFEHSDDRDGDDD